MKNLSRWRRINTFVLELTFFYSKDDRVMWIKEEDKPSPKVEDSENKESFKVEESKVSLKLERSDNGVGRASDQPEGCERNSVDLTEEVKQPQVNLKARTDEPMVCICAKLVFVPYLLRGRLSTARVLTKTTLKFR
jgi:hypothetical protein